MAGTKAQLEFTADASGVEAGVAKVKRTLADLGATAQSEGKKAADGIAAIGKGTEQAAARTDAATKNLGQQLERYLARLESGKKTGADFFESLGARRGANLDALKPLLDQVRQYESRIKAATSATVDFSKVTTSLGATGFSKPLGNPTTSLGATSFGTTPALPQIVPTEPVPKDAVANVDAYTKSVKQLAMQHQIAAVQVKDFFEQVVSGGSPLRAFALQGAAVVSTYGGFGATLKALAGIFTPLRVAIGATAGVVATLAVAMYQGAQEANAYAKALTLTGNSIGKTTDQLKEMAASISKTTGTQGDAAEALAALAESGKIATSSLSDVGAAVVSMNRVLGTSVDKAVDVFAKLGDEPAKASAKLNESMHYLNLETYERIRALEEQGDKESAAALAQSTYANETVARLNKVEQQGGFLSRMWRAMAKDAKDAWDQMQGIGRPQTIGEKISDLQQRLAERQQRGALNSTTGSAFDKGNAQLQSQIADLSRQALREQENAYAQGEKARADSAKIAASDRLKTLSEEVRTNADKRKKAIADLNRDFQTLGKATSGAEYDKLVANINEKFKDPKGPGEKAFTDDAATRMLETLRQTQASLKEQLDTDEKLTDAEKERAKFAQLIADLKGKKQLTEDQKSLLTAQDSIKAQLDINVELSKQLELKKEQQKLDEEAKRNAEEFARQMKAVDISIESANRSRSEQAERVLSTVGLGDRARAQIEAQTSIRREFEGYVRHVTKDAADKNQLDTDEFKNKLNDIAKARDEEIAKQQAFFDAETKARENWLNGATSALANYVDHVNDAAGRANELVTTTLTGLNEALTEFTFDSDTKHFKDFGIKIGKQIIAGLYEQNITKPIAEMLQSGLKDSDGWLGKLLGGVLGGKSDSGGLFGALGAGGKAADAASAAASTTALATSASTATASLAGLASAATAASAALGASSVGTFGSAAAVGSSLAFDEGGYTGDGGKYEPAGIVHKGEFVLTKEATSGIGPTGRAFLDRLNRRGYADGGLVAALSAPRVRASSGSDGGPVVNQVINFHSDQPTSRKTQDQLALQAGRGVQRAQRNA